jgi:hypothetical protein
MSIADFVKAQANRPAHDRDAYVITTLMNMIIGARRHDVAVAFETEVKDLWLAVDMFVARKLILNNGLLLAKSYFSLYTTVSSSLVGEMSLTGTVALWIVEQSGINTSTFDCIAMDDKWQQTTLQNAKFVRARIKDTDGTPADYNGKIDSWGSRTEPKFHVDSYVVPNQQPPPEFVRDQEIEL